jgi:hypothetical protein
LGQEIDLIDHSNNGFIDYKHKNPTLASTLSLVIPSGGQLYNGSFVKAGIVLFSDAYFLKMANYHDKERIKYKNKLNESDNEFEGNYYRRQMNYHMEKRQSSYWWVGITCFLSMADAYVDAHLYNFEFKKNEVEIRFTDSKLTLSYRF